METRRVNLPGRVGSPLTREMSAPGGSTGGTDQWSDSGWLSPAPLHPSRNHPDVATSIAREYGRQRTMRDNPLRLVERSRVEEHHRVSNKGVVELEERAVPSVGVDQQRRVGQVLGQKVRVSDRNHRVQPAVHYKGRLADLGQLPESLPIDSLPSTVRGDLGLRDLLARERLTILRACPETFCERLPGRLARLARSEEELHQNLVAGEAGISEDLAQLRLLQVHDVLTTLRGGSDQ